MSRERARYTYTLGSRPEGVVLYDEHPNGGSLKLHSHHDTDPARGQNCAYDVVRLHRYGHLDAACPPETSIADRPSSAAMVGWVNSLPEIRSERAGIELEDLGPLPRVTEELQVHDNGDTEARFRVHTASEFSGGAPMDWLVRSVLPRAELAVIYGESGSGKTFLALDLAAAISRGIQWRAKRTVKGRVVYICGEGAGGFKSRLRAYARGHEVELAELPAVIADAPNLLDPKDAAAITQAIFEWATELDKKEVK